MPKIESVHSPCACAGASLCAFAASRWHAGTRIRDFGIKPQKTAIKIVGYIYDDISHPPEGVFLGVVDIKGARREEFFPPSPT